METAMRYRTQGSLPISSQHKAQYLPKIKEEPSPISRGKAKPEAPLPQSQANKDQREKQSIPKIPTVPTPEPEPRRFKIPAHDPSKAVIETSPYYVYYKISTTNDAKQAKSRDLKSVLTELTIVDEELPKTAKYRHFKSYEH
ncbi:hypothetical protein GDO78_015660 [Eleutherodactylus coqui]|uniref:Uncharacterized protein n=1 Tax=Eleutherodactylus coqui TaxID=57060 RepID=A0A8J6EDF7_ELECQ|nr:hypothetical protein GDO78_015660 [Eleutherodactylus coqui]KAG9467082.1 hypothetical protein GDO78_015660 [Eleutherodactylus coqui]